MYLIPITQNSGTMKRLFIAAVILFLSYNAASAQQKGDVYLGGMAGLAIQAGSSGLSAGFALQPEFGYFVADKWRVGASIGYSYNGIHTLTVLPNFAYYARLCDGMYYTPGAEAGFVMAAKGGAYPGFDIALSLFSLEFRPTKHFGFTANLASLNFMAVTSAGWSTTLSIGANHSFGVKYYF